MNITIPVKSYLKKYLTIKYGPKLNVSKASSLGLHLIELLEKDFDPKNIAPIVGDDSYILDILEHYALRDGVCINPAKTNDISIYLDKVFREHLFEYVQIHKVNYGRELPAIKMFLEYYKITDSDLKYDSIYRDYKRFKERKKGTKNKKALKPS